MPIIEISSLSHPGIEVFSTLTEAQLRNRIEPDKGLFIAESPKVIRVALDAGYEPLALLCEQKHITGDAADIISRCGDVPVYTGGRELLATLTGYVLTRGVLCAMRRPAPRTVEDTCRDARRIVVIDGVVDTTNIGAIFRSAAALGMDAVLLMRNSCDPLNRRAVRVSMGSVFLVPWTWLDGTLSDLAHHGFRTAAMALTDDSISIADPVLTSEPRLAIVMGTEGVAFTEYVPVASFLSATIAEPLVAVVIAFTNTAEPLVVVTTAFPLASFTEMDLIVSYLTSMPSFIPTTWIAIFLSAVVSLSTFRSKLLLSTSILQASGTVVLASFTATETVLATTSLLSLFSVAVKDAKTTVPDAWRIDVDNNNFDLKVDKDTTADKNIAIQVVGMKDGIDVKYETIKSISVKDAKGNAVVTTTSGSAVLVKAITTATSGSAIVADKKLATGTYSVKATLSSVPITMASRGSEHQDRIGNGDRIIREVPWRRCGSRVVGQIH